MKSPQFSILLPTHNQPDTLAVALESVLAQTVSNFELLVVGDGCTDNTAEVVESFGDSRVTWLDFPKAPGFGYANRNVALQQARGELIAYQAHDDIWFADHLEQFAQAFGNPQIAIAVSRPVWVLPSGWMVPGRITLNDPVLNRDFFTRQSNMLPAPSFVYRQRPGQPRQLWNAELDREGDWDLWLRILGECGLGRLAQLPEPTTLHFRARWRTADQAPDEWIWNSLSDAGRLADSLRLPAEGGTVQQVAAWQQLGADGVAKWIELRRELSLAADQFAGETLSKLAHCHRRVERLRGELDRKSEWIQRQKDKLKTS